jgi:acetyltransferase-like isoleucine patch superfamily enzyme
MEFDFGRFRAYNGTFLTIRVIGQGILRRLHNIGVSRGLPGRPQVDIDPSARLRGLSCIHIAGNFRAGRHLWLEAVTRDDDTHFNPRIEIGHNVIVNDDVHIAATHHVTIGDDVLIASRVYISDHGHGNYRVPGMADPEMPPRLRPVDRDLTTIIEANVWIGDMVAVLPGVRIGRGSVIGSNSVVASDIPPHSIAVGAPARVVRRYHPASREWIRT